MNNITYTDNALKELNGLKLYNISSYNNLTLEMLPNLTGNLSGVFNLNIPASNLFTKMYGNITLSYIVNEDGSILIQSINPSSLFTNASNIELVEYKGIMISKENYEENKLKVDSILGESTQKTITNKKQIVSEETSVIEDTNENEEENMEETEEIENENTTKVVEETEEIVTEEEPKVYIPTTITNALNENYSFEDGTLVSDASAIYSSMNDIQNSIGNYVSGTYQYNGSSCQSESNIPGNMYILQSDMISAGMTLSNKLNYETSLIKNIADTIYEMDRDLMVKSNTMISIDQEKILSSSSILSMSNELVNYYSTDVISFKTNLFDSNNKEGKVGKICTSDIDKIYSNNKLTGALAQNFEYEKNSSSEILNELNNFTPILDKFNTYNSSKDSVWNQVSNKINDYCELLNNRIKANEELENAYIQALKLIKDYMGDYTELDDSKLPLLREDRDELIKKIEADKLIVNDNSGSFKEQENKDGEIVKVWVLKYSFSDKLQAKARIEENTTKKDKLVEEIELLEGLPQIMNEAEEIINLAYDNIKKYYCDSVSNVTTGKPVTYIPINIDIEEETIEVTEDYSNLSYDGIKINSESNSKLSVYAVETDGVIDYYYNNQELADKYGIYIKNKEYQQRAWNEDVNEISSFWSSKGGFGPNGCTVCSTCEAVSNVLQEEVLPTKHTTMKETLAYAKERGLSVSTIKSGKWSKEVAIDILEQGGQIVHSKTINGKDENGHFYTIVGYNEESDTFLTFDSYVTQTQRTNKPQNILTGTGYHEFTWEEYEKDRNGTTGGTITIVSKDPLVLSNNTDDNEKNDINITVK